MSAWEISPLTLNPEGKSRKDFQELLRWLPSAVMMPPVPSCTEPLRTYCVPLRSAVTPRDPSRPGSELLTPLLLWLSSSLRSLLPAGSKQHLQPVLPRVPSPPRVLSVSVTSLDASPQKLKNSARLQINRNENSFKEESRASLVAQWWRVYLPTQETRVWSLIGEDPTCWGATKPCAATTEPVL